MQKYSAVPGHAPRDRHSPRCYTAEMSCPKSHLKAVKFKELTATTEPLRGCLLVALVVLAGGCGGLLGRDDSSGTAATGGAANSAGGALSAGGAESVGGTTSVPDCPGYPSTFTLDAGALARCHSLTWNAAALPSSASCIFDLPAAQNGIVLTAIQVFLAPASGTFEEIPVVLSLADCDIAPGGFVLDDLQDPTVLTLCPCSCTRSRLLGGEVEMILGCTPSGQLQ